MMTPEEKLAELGLSLPPPIELPPTLTLPFSFINVRGNRALISGHPKQDASGAIAGPFGVVGEDLTTDQAQLEARGVGLSVLANLKADREIEQLSDISFRSSFFAGWSFFYIGISKQNSRLGRDNFVDALSSFC